MDAYEQDREDMAAGEGMFCRTTPEDLAEQAERDELIASLDREATEQEVDEALLLDEVECPECGHSATHGKYGCEYERGDAWVTGNQASQPTVLMAQGPCGCKYNAEREATDKALRDYAAAVKRMGKAFIALGRACDKEGV